MPKFDVTPLRVLQFTFGNGGGGGGGAHELVTGISLLPDNIDFPAGLCEMTLLSLLSYRENKIRD